MKSASFREGGFLRRGIKSWSLLITLSAILIVGGFFVYNAALAEHTTGVTVDLEYVAGGSTETYTFNVTNDGEDAIYMVVITAPDSFTINNNPSCPIGWTASHTETEAECLTDAFGGYVLTSGNNMPMSFSATAPSPEDDGLYVWNVLTKDANGGYEWNNTDAQTTVDVTKPTVLSVSSDGEIYNTDTESPVNIVVTFSEDIDISNPPVISVNESQTVTDCGDEYATTFCFDYTIPASTEDIKTITISNAKDLAGNQMDLDDLHIFDVDTIKPEVIAVDSDGEIFKAGVYTITVDFSEDVLNPQIAIAYSGIDGTCDDIPATDMTETDPTTHTYTLVVDDACDAATGTVTISNAQDLKDNTMDIDSAHSFTIDTLEPIFSEILPINDSYIGPISTIEYTLSENIVEGTITFNDGGIQVYELTDLLLNEGYHSIPVDQLGITLVNGTVYSISFDGIDVADNSAVTVTSTGVEYDDAVPTVSIADIPGDWQNTDASLTINCTDDGGSDCDITTIGYNLSPTPDNPGTCPTNSSEYTPGSSIDINYHTWICTYAEDNVGNYDTDGPYEIKVDRDIPTITDDYAFDETWVNSEQTVTLTPQDTGDSEIEEVRYCEGSECDPFDDGDILSEPYQLTYNNETDGTIVRYQVWDNAGNASELSQEVGSFTVKIDLTEPDTSEITSSSDGDYVKGIITIQANAEDNAGGSGLQKVEFYYDGILIDEGTKGEDITYSVEWNTIGLNGSYSLTVVATDIAGNSLTSEEISVTVDNTLPEIIDYTLQVEGEDPTYDNNVAFSPNEDLVKDTIDIDIEFSETVNYLINIKNEENIVVKSWSGEAQNPVARTWNDEGSMDDGDYIVEIIGTDYAENIVIDDSKTITLDTTGPIVDAGIDRVVNEVTIQDDASAEDEGSGIESYLWEQTSGSGILTFLPSDGLNIEISADLDGSYTAQLTVTDNVGNQSSDSINFTWDTIDPIVIIISPVEDEFIQDTGTITLESFADGTGSGVSCRYETDDGLSDSIDCGGGEITGLSDGQRTLTLIATDEATNTADAQVSFIIDTDGILNVPDDFDTIQGAIDAAISGNTINVDAGTYTENLIINKDLILQGIGAPVVIVNGTHSITSDNVIIDGFTFNPNGGIAITVDSSSSAISNIVINNNIFDLTDGEPIGILLGGYTSPNKVSNVEMSGNTFNGPISMACNPWKIGGWFGNPVGCEVENVDFENNIVNSCSIPINLYDKDITDILIDNNTFRNTDGVVYVWHDLPNPTGVLSGVVFTNNDVDSTNSYGVGIDTNNVFDDANFGVGNIITDNKFVGIPGAYGFEAVSVLSPLVTYKLNAEANWWGDATGPNHGDNPVSNGNGDAVSDNVDYRPWCIDEDCALPIDNEAPEVISTDPVDNAVGVSPDTDIIVSLNEAVYFFTPSIELKEKDTGLPVSFGLSEPGDDTIIISPDNLKSNTTYTVRILTSVSDASGNQLAGVVEWDFTTSASFSIVLYDGWNLISLPVIPTGEDGQAITDIEEILEDVGGINSVWLYDPDAEDAIDGWFVYHPEGEPETNSLTSMTPGYAYWVDYNNAIEGNVIEGSGGLFFAGNVTPPSRVLNAGWNLIGYYQRANTDEVPASWALANNLLGHWTSLMGFNNVSKLFTDISASDSMTPGTGYWVLLDGDITAKYIYAPGKITE